jgi:geranylgeranyl diphosphate synthase, type I
MDQSAKRGNPENLAGYFASCRSQIVPALEALARRRGSELAPIPGGGRESMARLAQFCLRGKMIRGCLVLLAANAASAAGGADARPELLAACAAAMELFQAGLLAHDDIMDRDETRRGEPTIHARYSAELEEEGSADHLHAGEALGICLGDLCYFEAFAELARVLGPHPQAAGILRLCAERLSEVAIAQMADVRWGAGRAEPSEEEILAMYRCKTARYSFSLPLAVGALVAGSPALVPALTELGEELGILFQLRDDELGLFGDAARTGKGRGSDLREGKKTLIRARLLAAAPRDQAERLALLFGGAFEAGPGDLDHIAGLAEKLGVRASLSELSAAAEARARALVAGLPGVGAMARSILESLVEYVTLRDR